jgi:hypothetical protein
VLSGEHRAVGQKLLHPNTDWPEAILPPQRRVRPWLEADGDGDAGAFDGGAGADDKRRLPATAQAAFPAAGAA